MKRVVKKDRQGIYVVDARGEGRLRPTGPSRFRAGEMIGLEMLGKAHAGAQRAEVWLMLRPKELTKETWDDGQRDADGMSPDQHALCFSVRKNGVPCSSGYPDERERWCESCLNRVPLDVDPKRGVNKPWRGTTPAERALLVAAVARKSRLNFKPIGERYLVAQDVASLFADVPEKEVVDWIVENVRPETWSVRVPKAEDAARYAAMEHGIDERQVLSVVATSTLGKFLVKVVKPKTVEA